MITLLAIRLKNRVRQLLRKLYWHYNFSRANTGPIASLDWPIVCEGKGKLELKSGARLGRDAELSVGKLSKLRIGAHADIRQDSVVRAGEGLTITIGDHFKLEQGSRLFIQKDWRIGDHVQIATDCALFSRESPAAGKLTIGSGTHIGDHTIIDVADDVTIGNNVAIGPNCVIYSHDHQYHQTTGPGWKGPLKTAPVEIGDGTWVGSGVTILPGVKIGEGAVIAAGAVVTKDVPSRSVCAGVPAKIINERTAG